MEQITFNYAFAEPHTITLCRPSASEKFIVEVSAEKIDVNFTCETLENEHPLTWKNHPYFTETSFRIFNGGEKKLFNKWYRHDSGAPMFFAESNSDSLDYIVSGIATRIGVIIKTRIKNKSCVMQDASAVFSNNLSWVISNQGWIDYENNNLLLMMNRGRADRIVAYGNGADDYPVMRNDNLDAKKSNVPMPNMGSDSFNPKTSMVSHVELTPNTEKTFYVVIPFEKYWAELSDIQIADYEEEIRFAQAEWVALLARSANIHLTDDKLLSCYKSCLADLFVMREKCFGDYYGISCGTYCYRSVNSGEPLLTEILLDKLGYRKEFETDIRMYIECQEENGCWAYTKGWEHDGWGVSFNKSLAILQHYYLTKDISFLEKNYKRMKRSSLFNFNARQSTKNDPEEAFRGLMPPGMGDCGLMNGNDYYGVFYPANCLSVASDKFTLEAATILGIKEDIEFLTNVYNEAKEDLLKSIRKNTKKEDGYERTTAIATADNTSLYGCLFPFYPAGLMHANDPIIQGTFRYLETKKISEGGLPLGTGWLQDGLWVAMALDNVAAAYLRAGKYDMAASMLYPVLNHASPFVTYCEERGAEANSQVKSGDMQHLWTPLAVCSYVVDAFIYEDDNSVHLCSGFPRSLLDSGKKISVEGLCTKYGLLNLSVENLGGKVSWSMHLEREVEKSVILHVRTPEDTYDIKLAFDCNGATSGCVNLKNK